MPMLTPMPKPTLRAHAQANARPQARTRTEINARASALLTKTFNFHGLPAKSEGKPYDHKGGSDAQCCPSQTSECSLEFKVVGQRRKTMI